VFYAIKKLAAYTIAAGQSVHSYRDTVAIKADQQILFGSFSKCLYPVQKFDSDTERRFSVILEARCPKSGLNQPRPVQNLLQRRGRHPDMSLTL